MKTLRYVLSGKACSIDDCLDLCCKEKPQSITIEIDYEDNFLDFDVYRRLIARSIWELSDRRFECLTIHGGYLFSDTNRKKQKATDRANAHLQSQLAKIERRGFEIQYNGRNSFRTILMDLG